MKKLWEICSEDSLWVSNVVFFQVLLAKHKSEEKFYAIKVLHKAAIRKRNEVSHLTLKFSKCCILLDQISWKV